MFVFLHPKKKKKKKKKKNIFILQSGSVWFEYAQHTLFCRRKNNFSGYASGCEIYLSHGAKMMDPFFYTWVVLREVTISYPRLSFVLFNNDACDNDGVY